MKKNNTLLNKVRTIQHNIHISIGLYVFLPMRFFTYTFWLIKHVKTNICKSYLHCESET